MHLSTGVEGPLAVADAWERYAELRCWSDWAPQITGVRADASRLAPGVSGRVLGPLGVPVPFVVTEVDHARHRWAWTAGGGTRAWLRIRPPVPLIPVAAAYLPLATLALRRLVTP